jgi:hypothetical protein
VIYADPSFLFSLYAWDENTKAASAAFSKEQRRPIFFTPWQRFELRNAVRLASGRLMRSGLPLLFQTGNVFKAVQEDIKAGRLEHAEPDWRETLRLAEELSDAHTEQIGSASVDVWHVAAAVLLGADIFWTFDGTQQKLASKCGHIPKVPKFSTV